MAAPGTLGYSGAAATSDHVVGPIVFGLSLAAAWPLMRPLRWADLAAGVWLLIAPWILGYQPVSVANSSVVGIVLVALTFLGGVRRKRFGGGWPSVLKGNAREQR